MLTVIGCGNTNRCDDAAGVLVAQHLQRRLAANPIPAVRVFDAGTSGIDTMFQARGSTALIVVDANLSDSPPGTVFQVPGEELENVHQGSFSLHDFRWDHALYAGRKIFRKDFPEDVKVFLIEAQCVDLGLEVSAAVEAAIEKVVELIWQRLKAGACAAVGADG
ncbi:MAG: hydrogenase maturation protease [Pseudomonadota bacterium]